MHGWISHPCYRASFEEDGRRPHEDRIWRPNAYGHVSHACRRQAADENRWGSRSDDRPAHVRDGRNTWCRHGAHVHVGKSCNRLRHLALIPQLEIGEADIQALMALVFQRATRFNPSLATLHGSCWHASQDLPLKTGTVRAVRHVVFLQGPDLP